MRIHYLLGGILSPLVLLGSVRASFLPEPECNAQAWVRAPDLAPNTVVQGDVGVKISAGCPVLDTVSLGLRFKERSFVRALRSREDAKWMHLEHALDIHHALLGTFPALHSVNHSARFAYEETLKNRDLWVDREEERIVFETTQAIHIVGEDANHDIVQDFSILVPSTNFPPAPDYVHSGLDISSELEVVHAESIYEYFVRVSFADGTTNEISAGFTAFQPVFIPADGAPQSPSLETIELKARKGILDSPSANYTAQISAVSGLVFTEGLEDQVVSVVITRTGPARTLSTPLMVRGCVDPAFLPRWAVGYDLVDLEPMPVPRYVLRSTSEDVEDAEQNPWSLSCISRLGPGVSVVMPNSTSDQPQANDIITTSATVMIPVEVDRRLISHFETYYQTFGSTLVIVLRTPPAEEGSFDQDLSSELDFTWAQVMEVEDDNNGWGPLEQKKILEKERPDIWDTYSGSVPVVVHPAVDVTQTRDCLHSNADMSRQVVMSDDSETGCERVPLIHYLAEGAREPIFVDGNAVQGLLAKDPAERDALAPFLDPVMSSPPEGEEEELVYRYFRDEENPYKRFIYVGETWVKRGDEYQDMSTLHHRIVGNLPA